MEKPLAYIQMKTADSLFIDDPTLADAEDNPVITKAMLETQLDDLVNEITVLETQIAQKMQQRDVIQQQLSEFEADEQIAPVREDNKPELCLS